MRKTEKINYDIAGRHDGRSPFSVTLAMTPSKSGRSWSFRLSVDNATASQFMDVLDDISGDSGFVSRYQNAFSSMRRVPPFTPILSGHTPFGTSGTRIPCRDDIVRLIGEAFLPIWRDTLAKLVEYDPEADWTDNLQSIYLDTQKRREEKK